MNFEQFFFLLFLPLLSFSPHVGLAIWCCVTQVALSSFATYILVADGNLDATKAFVSLSLFNILRFPLSMLPMLITNLIQVRMLTKALSLPIHPSLHSTPTSSSFSRFFLMYHQHEPSFWCIIICFYKSFLLTFLTHKTKQNKTKRSVNKVAHSLNCSFWRFSSKNHHETREACDGISFTATAFWAFILTSPSSSLCKF